MCKCNIAIVYRQQKALGSELGVMMMMPDNHRLSTWLAETEASVLSDG